VAFNRKDDLQTEFVRRAFRLKQVKLRQCFVPNSEGQVRAVMARWGASVVPELLARPLLQSGDLVELIPDFALPVHLYWHCWNFDSSLLDALTRAITAAAGRFLVSSDS
jgi:LysR family transcriptional regulator (chromosome initiation inhibitor)